MNIHWCVAPDGIRYGCLCVRGQDHDEELFDIPVGEESETA